MPNTFIELICSAGSSVEDGENVLFDIAYPSGNVTYDSATGEITVSEAGDYAVQWWVATQSSASATGAVFSISTSNGYCRAGASPVKAGQVVGSAVITVNVAPVTISLSNTSGAAFFLPSIVPVKASLILMLQDTAPAADSLRCFAMYQFAHILSQMIVAYPTTWSVFSISLASFSGVPLDLYISPDAAGPGLLRLTDAGNNYLMFPLNNITAIYAGDSTVYNPSFTYLSPPSPLPPGCDADILSAIQTGIPVGTEIALRLGASVSASGMVYRNELGVLVLSDASGNTPIFVYSPSILQVTMPEGAISPAARNKSARPQVSIAK